MLLNNVINPTFVAILYIFVAILYIYIVSCCAFIMLSDTNYNPVMLYFRYLLNILSLISHFLVHDELVTHSQYQFCLILQFSVVNTQIWDYFLKMRCSQRSCNSHKHGTIFRTDLDTFRTQANYFYLHEGVWQQQ